MELYRRQRITRCVLSDHQKQVHSLFEELIHKAWGSEQWQIPLDVVETEDAFVVTVDAPGMTADQIELITDGSNLVIQGHRDKKDLAAGTQTAEVHLNERPAGYFCRILEFPFVMEPDRIRNSMDNGVFRITILKPTSRKDDSNETP